MALSLGIFFSLLAALFAYLSWKRSAMGSTYEREEVLRNRLKDSANVTEYYHYQLGRVQVAELGGWGYAIWKYLPVLGGIRGDTLVYLYFATPDGQTPPHLPTEEEITSHPRFEPLPITDVTWKEPVSQMPEGARNLEVVFGTVDPDEVAKSIADISGIMMDINSDHEDPPFRDSQSTYI